MLQQADIERESVEIYDIVYYHRPTSCRLVSIYRPTSACNLEVGRANSHSLTAVGPQRAGKSLAYADGNIFVFFYAFITRISHRCS